LSQYDRETNEYIMDQDEYVLWKEYFENMEKDDAELSYGDYKMHHRETQQVLERIQNECAVKF